MLRQAFLPVPLEYRPGGLYSRFAQHDSVSGCLPFLIYTYQQTALEHHFH